MRSAITVVATCALALSFGCQRNDQGMSEKLESIDNRMGKMERHLAALSAGRGAAKAPAKQRRRPKPELTYSVPVEGTPIIGDEEALVTIVEGFEFACGWCEKSRPLVKEVLAQYKGKVRLAHKSYLVHPDIATVPALAGCAANKQGKFAAIEPLIWDKGFKTRKFDKANMTTLAGEAGLDVKRFEKDMASPECRAQLKRDMQELAAVGVSGTPAFFINGRWLPRRSKAEFVRLIDEELAKAEKRIAEGTPARDYYAQWVVAKGRKKL